MPAALAAGDADAAVVARQVEHAARAVQGFDQRHGCIVDRLHARRAHFTIHVDALAAERKHAYRHLGVAHHAREHLGDLVAHVVGRPARDLHHAGIRKLDIALRANYIAGHIRATAHCGDLIRGADAVGLVGKDQFRVIPHHHRDDVARADEIGLRLAIELVEFLHLALRHGALVAHHIQRDRRDVRHGIGPDRAHRRLGVEVHARRARAGGKQQGRAEHGEACQRPALALRARVLPIMVGDLVHGSLRHLATGTPQLLRQSPDAVILGGGEWPIGALSHIALRCRNACRRTWTKEYGGRLVPAAVG